MSDHLTNHTVSAMLEHLEESGFSPDQAAIKERADRLQSQEKLPLYLHVLMGVGALTSSTFLLIFLTLASILDFKSTFNLAFIALIFMGGGVILHLKAIEQPNRDLSQTFWVQFSFILVNMGRFLIGASVGLAFNSPWMILCISVAITSITYTYYQVSIDRFLSSLGCLVLLLVCILNTRLHDFNPNILFMISIVAHLFVIKYLWVDFKLKNKYVPLGYAVISSLCVNILLVSSVSHIGRWSNKHQLLTTPITVALAGALIGLIIWAANGVEQVKTSKPLMMSLCGVMLLGAFSAPGVLLSLGLMILGYATHERLITLFGILLLPLVIFNYYYNLNVSLMEKSLILIGTGAVLIIGRMYLLIQLRHQQGQRERLEVPS